MYWSVSMHPTSQIVQYVVKKKKSFCFTHVAQTNILIILKLQCVANESSVVLDQRGAESLPSCWIYRPNVSLFCTMVHYLRYIVLFCSILSIAWSTVDGMFKRPSCQYSSRLPQDEEKWKWNEGKKNSTMSKRRWIRIVGKYPDTLIFASVFFYVK